MEKLSLVNLVITLLFLITIFLLLREVVCWYWKINRHIELQEETNKLLQKIVEQTTQKSDVKTLDINK